jgi:hypothetical protein
VNVHFSLIRCRSLLRQRGQGTVEYVGIVLAVGALLLALATPMHGLAGPIASKLGSALKQAIDDTVGAGKGTH